MTAIPITSIMILHKNTRSLAQTATTSQFCVPCLSNNIPNCAVTIIAEAKATALLASHTVAKIQWSLGAYSQIMDRISIARGATYADDKNICQYGIFHVRFKY